MQAVNEKIPFIAETDALDNAISAALNQETRPAAFFSGLLSKSKQHSSIEKEEAAIVESVGNVLIYLRSNFLL